MRQQLRKFRGWLCYRIVMVWPRRWSHNRLGYWLLAHAGDWAFGDDHPQGLPWCGPVVAKYVRSVGEDTQ